MDLSHRSVLNQLGDKPHILLSKRCMIQADTIYVLFHIQCGLLSVELTQDVLCNNRNLARLCVVELNYYKKIAVLSTLKVYYLRPTNICWCKSSVANVLNSN